MAIENPVAARRITEFQEQLDISDRELARRVFERWSTTEKELPLKDAAGLAVKLGHLKKGVLTWWVRKENTGAVRALADELGRDVSELEIREASDADAHFFRFDDHRELRDIDLRAESVYVLGQPNWFSKEWFSQPTPAWIEAPPGAGKSLVAKWHAAHGTAAELRVARLIDAFDRLPDGPVVIDVEGAYPESDREALRALRTRKQLLVLAPFSPPPDDDDDAPKIKKRSMFPRAEAVPLQSGFSCHRWQPDRGWRPVFIKWISDRQKLGDGWTERVVKWIDGLDPMGNLFNTPGAVLPLVRFLWTGNPTRFRKDEFVEDWLSLTVAKSATDRSPCSLWLQTHGRELVEALIESRFADANLPWTGGLSRAQWAALVPQRLAARLAGEAVRRELANLVKASSRRSAKEIEKTARRLEEPAPEEAIQYLVAARLLRPVGADNLEIHPRWIAEWHAAGYAFSTVESGPAAAWGRWAVDAARRPHVDAALDRLGAAQFKAVTRRALQQWDPSSLGSAAALECLFWAVARRLHRGERPIDAAAADELLQRQNALIQRREGWAPEPLTRPGLQGRTGSGPAWIACCWTWSLRSPRPSVALGDEDAWLFPGWLHPALSSAPKWFEWMHLNGEMTQEEAEQWDWLISMTRSIVERCDDAELPSQIPEILFPEVLRAVPARKWTLTPEIAHYFFYNGLTPPLTLEAIKTLPESDQAAIARRVWQALIVEKVGDPPLWNLEQAPAVFDFIVQRLSEDDVRHAVREKKLTFAFLNPVREGTHRRLPIPLWEAALHELLVVEKSNAPLPHNMDDWPRWTAPIVEALIGMRPNLPDWMGIRSLWAVDPDRALQRAAAAYPDDPSAMYWVSEGWSLRRDAILEFIEQSPLRPLPIWARQWLARNLPSTPGAGADRIFALLATRASGA
jgi:hypothetical protein